MPLMADLCIWISKPVELYLLYTYPFVGKAVSIEIIAFHLPLVPSFNYNTLKIFDIQEVINHNMHYTQL